MSSALRGQSEVRRTADLIVSSCSPEYSQRLSKMVNSALSCTTLLSIYFGARIGLFQLIEGFQIAE